MTRGEDVRDSSNFVRFERILLTQPPQIRMLMDLVRAMRDATLNLCHHVGRIGRFPRDPDGPTL